MPFQRSDMMMIYIIVYRMNTNFEKSGKKECVVHGDLHVKQN